MLEPGHIIADRYAVERLLAHGGMATVYVVQHIQLHSLHALKVLDIPTPGIRERLLLEGRIQASLKHPNIVAVTDAIDVDGQPGLVMEFVEGPSLGEHLYEHTLSLDQALAWFETIAQAVGYAHERGLVHRDLKPDNVLLDPWRGGFVPKVADFGIAKVLQETRATSGALTATGVGMGTPAYMPPEQLVSAGTVDLRADIFALGCILYEMVCGERAFPGENVLSIFNRVAEGDYAPPTDLTPGLPDRVVRAIDGCLRPKPEDRFASCTALIAALNPRHETVPATAFVQDAVIQPMMASPGAMVPVAVPREPSPPRTRSRSPRRRGTGATWIAAGLGVGSIGFAVVIAVVVVIVLFFVVVCFAAMLSDPSLYETGPVKPY